MDTRRLSTGDVLAAGIIDQPAPTTDVPDDRVKVGIYIDEFDAARVATELEAGHVVDCSEYYGIPVVPVAWKADDGYHAILLQYRNVTENHVFATAAECADWFEDTAYAVAG